MTDKPVDVRSEIEPLRTVLLHRPGMELEQLTPRHLEGFLFDDIPWLERMREEHDRFAELLRSRGVRVFYYVDLLNEAMADDDIRRELTAELVRETRLNRLGEIDDLVAWMDRLAISEFVDVLISGLRKDREDLPGRQERSLASYILDDFPFYIPPIPNLYFTRDPGAAIGGDIAISKMNTTAREREPLLLEILRRHHPSFQDADDRYGFREPYSLEGGDVLVLSDRTVAVGCSERTSAEAIESLAVRLFEKEGGPREVLAIKIPFRRSFMHLDTVLTQVDYDKFIIYPGIEEDARAYRLTPRGKDVHVEETGSITMALAGATGNQGVELIRSGGGDTTTADREQWNDSANTLAVAPGVVVTYNRNVVSNDTLADRGIEVLTIEGSELVRGRGGPRCMSMPLKRGG